MDLPQTISLLHRKMNMELNSRLRRIGLSKAKARLLRYIYENGEMTQSDLCSELDLDKSTVAKALFNMENSGLIVKKVKPDDTRSFLVSLTPKAEQIIPKTNEIFSRWTEDITSELNENEKKMFYKLLHKVTHKSTKICNK